VAAVAGQFKVDVQKPGEFNRIEGQAPLDIQGIRGFVKAAFTLASPIRPRA